MKEGLIRTGLGHSQWNSRNRKCCGTLVRGRVFCVGRLLPDEHGAAYEDGLRRPAFGVGEMEPPDSAPG